MTQAHIISVSKRRRLLIHLFYRYLLLNHTDRAIQQDLLDETQGKLDETTFHHANLIVTHQSNLIEEIKNLLARNQSWSRLPFLVQSILLVGTYEIKHMDTPRPVTINEMTQIAKDYGLTSHAGFINALLDKISHSE